jgi:branched-chain amino acid transport system ATP-binding protein
MLAVENLTVSYGGGPVLRSVSLACAVGEIVAVVGPNGAGKTTLLRTISGIKRGRGSIRWHELEVSGKAPRHITRLGINHVPEGRGLFAPMTVAENLRIGGLRDWRRDRRQYAENLGRVHSLFPLLAKRSEQQAGALSGGEQQMLAIGRALMNSPKILMLDEPSLGLAPIIIERIYEVLVEICASGVGLLIVEANAERVPDIASRVIILSNGEVMRSEMPAELTLEQQRRALFGDAPGPGSDLPMVMTSNSERQC